MNSRANLNVDFQDIGSTSSITFTPSGAALWDSAVWDSDLWAADTVTQQSWQGASAIGYCAAPRLQTTAGGVILSWVATDIVFDPGAVL